MLGINCHVHNMQAALVIFLHALCALRCYYIDCSCFPNSGNIVLADIYMMSKRRHAEYYVLVTPKQD